MPYALFEGDDQLSRAYPTEAEVWSHADEAGLIDKDGEIERLEDDFSIKALCAEYRGGMGGHQGDGASIVNRAETWCVLRSKISPGILA